LGVRFLVLPEYYERVRDRELRVLHLQWTLVLLQFQLVLRTLDHQNPLLCLAFFVIELQNLAIGYQGFVWLSALFIKHTQVVPHLAHLRVQSRGFDYVFKGVCVVTCVVVEYSQCCPVHGLGWVSLGRVLEVLFGFCCVFQSHVTSAQNVE